LESAWSLSFCDFLSTRYPAPSSDRGQNSTSMDDYEYQYDELSMAMG